MGKLLRMGLIGGRIENRFLTDCEANTKPRCKLAGSGLPCGYVGHLAAILNQESQDTLAISIELERVAGVGDVGCADRPGVEDCGVAYALAAWPAHLDRARSRNLPGVAVATFRLASITISKGSPRANAAGLRVSGEAMSSALRLGGIRC